DRHPLDTIDEFETIPTRERHPTTRARLGRRAAGLWVGGTPGGPGCPRQLRQHALDGRCQLLAARHDRAHPVHGPGRQLLDRDLPALEDANAPAAGLLALLVLGLDELE